MGECYPVQKDVENAVHAYQGTRHPGLLLDAYVPYESDSFEAFNQQKQGQHLGEIAKAMGDAANASKPYLSEWDDLVKALCAVKWELTTVWRLAAHLARPNALENASLCLHPIYGFPYLPGSGLKGLAVAYADSLGVKEDDPQRRRIFGTTTEGSGSVIFLDAWPREWPRVEVDITNSHHKDYYSEKGGKPPGDWESPNPVYFLTVAPGQTFRFALAKAHPRVADNDIEQAKKWLEGGLKELGFGAKTAAGYGYFRDPTNADQVASAGARKSAQAAQPAAIDPIETLMTRAQQWLRAGGKPGEFDQVLAALKKVPAEQREEAAEKLISLIQEHSPHLLKHKFSDGSRLRDRILLAVSEG